MFQGDNFLYANFLNSEMYVIFLVKLCFNSNVSRDKLRLFFSYPISKKIEDLKSELKRSVNSAFELLNYFKICFCYLKSKLFCNNQTDFIFASTSYF